MRLSPHFTLEELVHSDTALRLGIENFPPDDVIENLRVLATGLEHIRSVLDDRAIIVSSGYRCEALERVLCWKDYLGWCRRNAQDPDTAWGAYFSRKAHPKGFAGDWTCPGFGTPRACILEIQRAGGVTFDQLIEEGTWVHSSFDPRSRGQVLTATFHNGEPSYTAGVA